MNDGGLNMFPDAANDNRAHGGGTHIKCGGYTSNRVALFSEASNGAHGIWSQFVMKSNFTSRIVGIVFGCSGKEMVRPYTRAIVTRMANNQAILNRAIGQRICYAVRPMVGFFRPEDTVTIPSATCRPSPAAIGFVHLSPESSRQVGEFRCVGTGVAAIFQAKPSGLVILRFWRKGFITKLADLCHRFWGSHPLIIQQNA